MVGIVLVSFLFGISGDWSSLQFQRKMIIFTMLVLSY